MDNSIGSSFNEKDFISRGAPTSQWNSEYFQAEIRSLFSQKIPELGGNRVSFPQAETSWEKDEATEAPVAFIASVSWVGKVDSINEADGTFSAILTSPNSPDEYAQIGLDEVSEDDLKLLRPGAVFYWSVGQSINEAGRKVNESVIRFRRLRHWTRGEIERSRQSAKKYHKWLTI